MNVPEVVVYGADWCPLTKRALIHLKQKRIKFDYIDVEEDEQAAQWVREQSDGKEKKPTIRIGDQILVEPSDSEIDRALGI